MHKPAIPDWRQHHRKRNFVSKDSRSQVANIHRHSLARPEHNFLERPAVLTQRDFPLSAAVEIIKYRTRHSPFRNAAKVGNIYYARRREFSHVSSKNNP
jgi:hypothetical protein